MSRPVDQKGGGAGGAEPSESTRLLARGGVGMQPIDMSAGVGAEGLGLGAGDDTGPVQSMVFMAARAFGVFLMFGVVGIASVVMRLQGVEFPAQWGRAAVILNSYWVAFAPFWVADLYVLIVQVVTLVKCLRLRAFMPEEQRNIVRVSPKEAARTISLEMLPLVRDLMVTAVLTLPSLALLFATQLLLCLHMEHGRPGPFAALGPLLLLEALGLLYSILVRSGSHLRTVGWALLLPATASIGLHASQLWPLKGEGWQGKLWVALVPAWTLQGYLLAVLVWVTVRSVVLRRLRLGWRHGVCMALYALALGMLALAEVLLCWRALGRDLQHALVVPPSLRGRTSSHGSTPSPLPPVGVLSGVAAIVGVGLGALALFLVAEEEVDHLITTHGYADPLPLSRTGEGWGPTGARTTFWLPLGRIEEEARPGSKARSKQGAKSPAEAANREERKALTRTNSGSYTNLEEDL